MKETLKQSKSILFCSVIIGKVRGEVTHNKHIVSLCAIQYIYNLYLLRVFFREAVCGFSRDCAVFYTLSYAELKFIYLSIIFYNKLFCKNRMCTQLAWYKQKPVNISKGQFTTLTNLVMASADARWNSINLTPNQEKSLFRYISSPCNLYLCSRTR